MSSLLFRNTTVFTVDAERNARQLAQATAFAGR